MATAQLRVLRLDHVIVEHTLSATGFSKTFTSYNDLPVELQMMIWEATFPEAASPEGRLIQFSIPLWALRYVPYKKNDGDPRPPIALHVCRLSRETILKTYRLIHETHIPYGDVSGRPEVRGRHSRSLFPVPLYRPICFNPKADQFCIDSEELHDYPKRTELYQVVKRFPGCLDDIQILEIREVNWLPRVYPSGQTDGENGLARYARNEYGALSFFRNLKELYIVSTLQQDPCRCRHGLLATTAAHRDVMRWYEAARDMDPEGSERSIPQVSFHCYRQKCVMPAAMRRDFRRLRATASDAAGIPHW